MGKMTFGQLLDRDTDNLTVTETEEYIAELEDFISAIENSEDDSEDLEEMLAQAEDTVFYLRSLLKIQKK